jgi:hypothetical protein
MYHTSEINSLFEQAGDINAEIRNCKLREKEEVKTMLVTTDHEIKNLNV